MSTALILIIAMVLDAALGEPRWLWSRAPHPAVLMGQIIGKCDALFNTGATRRLKGIGVVIGLSSFALLAGWLLGFLGPLAELLIAAILLAQRSLVDHVRAVGDALRVSLGDGQRSVGMIVGRETAGMTPPDVARAAIESAAENLSDGVIAPAFWFLVAGLPGILLYKIINTADSMIGHRTERHARFGWAAARLDDILNIIPARLTGLMIALLGGQLSNWSAIVADARQHRSPNAGWPEAAMARTLGIALSGPRRYAGQLEHFPFVHASGLKEIGADEIDAACTVLWQTWALTLVSVMALAIVL